MIASLITTIKHLVAGNELAQLEQHRTQLLEARRFLNEFPDAAAALDYVSGAYAGSIVELRDAMRMVRRSRARNLGHFIAPNPRHAQALADLADHWAKKPLPTHVLNWPLLPAEPTIDTAEGWPVGYEAAR